jgi:exopolysaccharide production protein ExoZ
LKIQFSGELKVAKILLYLGNASYSIYLTQGPVISAIAKFIHKANLEKYFDGFFAPTLVALIAIAIGCIFHSLVEKPLMELSRSKISYT